MPTTHPEIVLILARADNGVIGRDGTLPWHLPADLRHFKMLTQGRPMVMGRKTFDSLPGLLEGRRHIVLTRDMTWAEDGAEVAHDVDDAIRLANAPVIIVIGDEATLPDFIEHADRIEITEFSNFQSLPGFELDQNIWFEASRERMPQNSAVQQIQFITLKRHVRD